MQAPQVRCLGPFILVLLSAAAQWGLAGTAAGQTLPTRNQFVWHIYVDPLHGDNTRAMQQNPEPEFNAPNFKRPLDFNQEPKTPKPIGGILQHSPYPFKTLTGSNGAIAYAERFFAATLPQNKLPWISQNSFLKTVDRILIHCRPGLYGPVGGPLNLPAIDPISGLPWNGETWPAVIRSGVSIQGTSGLDTIFDARGMKVAVISVNEPQGGDSESHVNSFIDSVTVRGARAYTDAGQVPPGVPDGAGAGIHICNIRLAGANTPQCAVTISNCFIYDNTVGIAVNCYTTEAPSSYAVPHRPFIVNNTIAWNSTGLWQGVIPTAPGLLPTPRSSILNNIFDSGTPSITPMVSGISGFEGVSEFEVRIQSAAGQFLQPDPATGLPISFNAWEYGGQPSQAYNYINTGLPIAVNWPAVMPPTLPPELSPYRGWTSIVTLGAHSAGCST